MNQQFLVCESPEHAQIVDGLICESIREKDNNLGSQWSGIYYNESLDLWGVLWANEVGDVFGDDPEELIAVEEIITDGLSDWTQFTPEPEPTPEIP